MRRTARIILLLWASVACSGKSPTRTLDVVKLADRGFLTNAPLYIAEAEGFFAEEGIRLEYMEVPRSTGQILPLLERGDLDVVTGSISSAFYGAIAQGARMRIVADRGHIPNGGCSYSGIMARKGLFDSAAPTAATLRGRRMSLGASGAYGYIADNYFASVGLSTKDMNIVRLSETLETQALHSGAIDLMHVSEPYLSRLVAEGNKLIGPSSVYSPGAQYATVVFGPTLTVQRRDVGLRFMKAYLKGVKQSQEGATSRNIEIVSQRTKLDPALLRKVCMPELFSDGHIDSSKLLKFQEWAVRSHHIDRVLGADAGLDMSFAREAAKELGIRSESK
jgi:NitT/TauT family transport system substrate-binding protein